MGGIISGLGTYSQTGNGYTSQYKGVAPAAKLVNLKVLDNDGSGLTSNVIAALDWCYTNRAKYKIRVINLSLGHPVFESYKTDPLSR